MKNGQIILKKRHHLKKAYKGVLQSLTLNSLRDLYIYLSIYPLIVPGKTDTKMADNTTTESEYQKIHQMLERFCEQWGTRWVRLSKSY